MFKYEEVATINGLNYDSRSSIVAPLQIMRDFVRNWIDYLKRSISVGKDDEAIQWKSYESITATERPRELHFSKAHMFHVFTAAVLA